MSNSQSATGFVKKTGDTMSGDLNMGAAGNIILAADKLVDGQDVSAMNQLNYVSRGNIEDEDWDKTGFTTDETWRDLDLSGIIPVETKLVVMRINANSSTGGKVLEFKNKGFANDMNGEMVVTQADSRYTGRTIFLTVDANRKIQYKMQNTTWNVIALTVRGWFV